MITENRPHDRFLTQNANSSTGFGLQFLAMAQADGGSGLWPVTLSRMASVVVIAGVLPSYGGR
ncbi:hypothetical protein ABZT04_39580 [Streptomyces sp. NPDC005492]|uniref:hypothetical protein n=1 Tax=Streptomyces sp. NPDC005492 TaxID=3156883 RepID=UPI0033BE1828